MKALILCLCFVLCASEKSRPNVLFLMADDMRPLSADEGTIKTPNLHQLASKSLLLNRAYVQQAVCNPSRASLLTGRRPDTTRVHDFLHYWRESGGNFTTIPQYFKDNGFLTVGMGKIFHPGHSSGQDDPVSWSDGSWYFHANNAYWADRMKVSWSAVDDDEAEEHPLQDMQIADHAKMMLKRIVKRRDKGDTRPFFMAVGFHRPHLPFFVPKKFYNMYPRDKISLPSNPYAPWHMPEFAWADNAELRQYRDFQDGKWYGGINQTLSDEAVINLRHGYYASMSYTDSLIGDILTTLDALGLSDNTIISFISDHGWQLGEHGEWSKSSNFEVATHTPMMIRVPGSTDHGVSSDALVEFVDLFPTLVDLAGLPSVPQCPSDTTVMTCHEGVSIVPLISNPDQEWKSAAFSQYPRMYISGDVIMGYSMRTDRYRYAEWKTYDAATCTPTEHSMGYELYDHQVDPEENINRANDNHYADTREELHRTLNAGWRHALPPSAKE